MANHVNSGSTANRSAALILLSSYNGARYIGEQIESIRAQTFRDWRLLIRDDGSSDETRSIVSRFIALDDRVEMLDDNRGNVGPWVSFGLLLSAATKTDARYVFLADQDDVWDSGKMQTQLEVLKDAEKLRGASHPILTHSDLEVVGDELEPIHRSFREYQGLSHDFVDPLQTLLIHSGMMGCTIAINRALLDIAVPLPAESPHDWWLGLCAAATGTVIATEERTVRYRQHASNTIGARPMRDVLSQLTRHPLAFISESLAAFDVGVRQSVELDKRLTSRALADAETRRRVHRYTDVFDSQPLRTRLKALRESGAKPRRPLSVLFLFGIVAAFPRWKSRRRNV